MATTRRADMFTADGKPSDDDPREHRQRLGDERVTLAESLRCQRLTLKLKCEGLDAEAIARRSVEPSTMSLLGLVRHLAEGERATFRVLMAGQDVPRLFCSPADPDGDFNGAVPDPQVVAEAWAAWQAEVDFATEFVARAPSLDVTADDPGNRHGSGGGAMSLREVLDSRLPPAVAPVDPDHPRFAPRPASRDLRVIPDPTARPRRHRPTPGGRGYQRPAPPGPARVA